MAAICSDTANQLDPLKTRTQYGRIAANSMIDDGSICSIITKINRILKSTPFARWINTKQDKVLKTFSNEPIKILGKIATNVIYIDWI